jgi:hypothetical protein
MKSSSLLLAAAMTVGSTGCDYRKDLSENKARFKAIWYTAVVNQAWQACSNLLQKTLSVPSGQPATITVNFYDNMFTGYDSIEPFKPYENDKLIWAVNWKAEPVVLKCTVDNKKVAQ